MPRKNIFDIMQKKINVALEISKIDRLCRNDVIMNGVFSYTFEQFIDEICLYDWKNRNFFTRCEEIRQELEIRSFDVKNGLRQQQILIYLEYMANMIWLCNETIDKKGIYEVTKDYVYIEENLYSLIEHLNFEAKVFEDEEKVILVEKNAAATAVAEIIEPELAYDVIEYNHHTLKGNLETKQKILKVLADKFEALRPQLKNINKELESNTGYLLNKMNIRHNNITGKKSIEYVKKLSKNELEEWYDETYQMILICILEVDNIERNKKVSELKKIIEGK